jgi:hypothetical protein
MQGTVRSWILWDDAGVLLLNMKGNRFCGNINRQHKSNGIFYVVDFKVQAEALSQVFNPLLAELLKSPVCPCLAFKPVAAKVGLSRSKGCFVSKKRESISWRNFTMRLIKTCCCSQHSSLRNGHHPGRAQLLLNELGNAHVLLLSPILARHRVWGIAKRS